MDSYGAKGFAIIHNTLRRIYLEKYIDSTRRMAQPLTPNYLLQKVLVPEVALCLIAQDLSLPVNHPDALKNLADSRAYGAAMFPDDD